MNQRFEARYKISEGGNGLIRAGRDLQLSRDVAIKELRPCRSGEVERARLLREAHIQAQLQHPCMVPVYGIGQWDDGSPYYVMQQLSGMTLYDAVIALHASRSKKVILHCKTIEGAQIHLSFRDLIGRFKELCLAVEFAHQQGVIHRDITPKNLMLGYYGENHIIDWGTAKIESEQPEHAQQESLIPVATGSLHATSPSIESIGSQSLGAMLSASRQNMRTFTGAILGTPGFMSPEHQISAKNVDRLSDVFGLGATLYFIVAGRPPRNADLLKEKGGTGNLPNPKEHILTPSSKVQKRVDSQLEAIYLRAMNAKPELRYKSCRELADDLGRWLNGQPVRAREETLREKTKRWIRQRSASAIVAVVFIASGGAMLQHYFHARELSAEVSNHASAIVSLGDRTLRDYVVSPSKENSRLLAMVRLELLDFVQRRRSRIQSLTTTTRSALGNAAFLICRIDEQIGTNDPYSSLMTAKETLEKIYAFSPDEAILEMLYDVSHSVAKSLANRGELPEAIETIESTQKGREQLLAGVERLNRLARYARGCSVQGTYYFANNQPADAVDSYLKSIRARIEIDTALEHDPVAQIEFARSCAELAGLFRDAGHYDRALELYNNSLYYAGESQNTSSPVGGGRLLYSNLIAGDFQHLQAIVYLEIGQIHLLERNPLAAREAFDDANQVYDGLLSKHSDVQRYRIGKSQLLTWMALSYADLGDASQRRYLAEAKSTFEDLQGLPTQLLDETEVRADIETIRLISAWIDTLDAAEPAWDQLADLPPQLNGQASHLIRSRSMILRERLLLNLMKRFLDSKPKASVGVFYESLVQRLEATDADELALGSRLGPAMKEREHELATAELRDLNS